MKRTPLAGAALLVVVAIGIAVCSRQEQKQEQKPAPVAEGSNVTVKGSDTMVILAQRWAETYMGSKPGATIQVTGGGSGTGISALINGTTDIASSSRNMKDAERKQVKEKAGAEVKEIAVAKDGVTVYVNKTNPIASINLEQLQGIYQGKITSWKELGGADQKIVVYSRENSSGTYVFFKEHVLKGSDFTTRAQTLPGTAAVANAVEKDPAGIGYGGIAYGEGIKLLPINAGSGDPVTPSLDTIKSGAYPLSRPLFFYTRGEPTGASKAFIDWVLSPDGQAVVEKVGYFPL